MVRRNSAFRIAIGGLAVAVGLCLVAAVSLLWTASPSSVVEISSTSTENIPIQVASTGDVGHLLNERPVAKPVPDPLDETVGMSTSHSRSTARNTAPPLPGHSTSVSRDETIEPVETVSPPPPPIELEQELSHLRGQISDLARSQLESQLVEIRHAEQLLSAHQAQRVIEGLQHDVEQLKSAVPTPLTRSTNPISNRAEDGTAFSTEESAPPLTASVDIETSPVPFQSEPAPDESIAHDQAVDTSESVPVTATASGDRIVPSPETSSRVRYSASESNSSRFDIDADDATLPEFLAKLGPVAGWNLVIDPELSGTVTCRLTDVDLQQALTHVLKMHGWQPQLDGEFTLIEPLVPVPSESVEPDSNGEQSADAPSASAPPITLELSNDAQGQSTFDEATGILIQPRLPAHSVFDSRPQTINSALANSRRTTASASLSKESLSAPESTMSEPVEPEEFTPSTPNLSRSVPPSLMKPAPARTAPVDQQEEAKLEVVATFIEVKTPAEAAPGVFRGAIIVTNRGPCSKCGVTHESQETPYGHVCEGWHELNDGIRCGVSQTEPALILARLQEHSEASVTATLRREILNQQLAQIGLTEQQGFRRQITRGTSGKEVQGFLRGGVQLSLRPQLIRQEGIRVELSSWSATAESDPAAVAPVPPPVEFPATLTVPIGGCLVLGGMYFEPSTASQNELTVNPIAALRRGSPPANTMHEVVVLIQIQKARAEESPTAEAAVDTPHQ